MNSQKRERENEKERVGTHISVSSLIETSLTSITTTFLFPELSHMSDGYWKGGWEMKSPGDSLCTQDDYY